MKFASEIAIYDGSKEITYQELFNFVKAHKDPSPIFYAPPTLETIIHILALLEKKARICPISPHEKSLPKITLPEGDGTALATSGSMGFPKYVLHTMDTHIFSATHPHPDWVLQPGDRWSLSLPLNHIGGLAILFRAIESGAAIILPTSTTPPTHISFVSTQLKRYVENRIENKDLKGILVGGGSIPETLCKQALAASLPLYLTYGMTEMASQVATAKYKEEEGVHVGSGLFGREIKIDVNQEVLIKSPTMATSYLDSPLPLIDGWYQTGDLGEIKEGNLYILGRKDSMIISGGENIYLKEIENALLLIPGIIKAVVQSRKDDEFGERPTIRAVTENLSAQAIREALLTTLPRFKVPSEKDISIRFFK